MVDKPEMPSEVSDKVGWFDKFAGGASTLASRAWFFTFCVLLVLIWAPSILLLRDVDTWQLIINTMTTIVTFLMVALLQNSQTRADLAVQHKLNALADALGDLIRVQAEQLRFTEGDERATRLAERALNDVRELRMAVGLEERESTSDNANTAAPG